MRSRRPSIARKYAVAAGLVVAAAGLIAAVAYVVSCSRPELQRPPKPKPSLLGVRWPDPADEDGDWQAKDNTQLTLESEGGDRAIRIQSDFKPYGIAWAARRIEPSSMASVGRIRFRVHGDGSGHRLEVHLGVPASLRDGSLAPEGEKPLYYINASQAIRLDFSGPREVVVDLDRFKTPEHGDRDRDLQRVVFVEFGIYAKDLQTPVDIRVDRIEFLRGTSERGAASNAAGGPAFGGDTAAEAAARQRRLRTADELTRALPTIRRNSASLGEEIERASRSGKDVRLATVYHAALVWCADDLARIAECEDVVVVEEGRELLESLRTRAGDRDAVLRRIPPAAEAKTTDVSKAAGESQVAEETKVAAETKVAGDASKAAAEFERNPFLQGMLKDAKKYSAIETSFPKGSSGYRSIVDPWAFRTMGNDLFVIVRLATLPGSPRRHEPMLVRNALHLIDAIARHHVDGDFNVDRSAPRGRDANINRFCLAPALDAWDELLRAYPDLLPPAHRAAVERGLKRLVEHQVTEYGSAKLARRPEPKMAAYANMDAHYALIMESAHRLWKEPRFAKERDVFLGLMESSLYPDGGFGYVDGQNECFVYHGLNVAYLARLWRLSGDKRCYEMLRKSAPYYPYNMEPAGMPENYTDPSWKHNWGRADAAAPAIIAGLFDDPQNQAVAERCGALWRWSRGHVAAIAAECYRPIESRPQPDGYVRFDRNIEGPRGRFGLWSFAANGRDYGEGALGKDTFVGCMLTDPDRRPLPLDAALQIVTTEVRLSHLGGRRQGGRCLSAQEKLTTTTGPDFGSLAVRYALSDLRSQGPRDVLLPWIGVQQWYLSSTRLVGSLALEATADETRAAVHGRIRLGLQREVDRTTDEAWRYGRLRIRIHDHNYGRIVAKPSEASEQDDPMTPRSTELTLIDPVSLAAGQRGEVRFAKGTQYRFLIEVHRDAPDVAPAADVQRIEAAPIVGFRFREPDREVFLLHNPTDAKAAYRLPLETADLARAKIYADDEKQPRESGPKSPELAIDPQRHATVVVPRTE